MAGGGAGWRVMCSGNAGANAVFTGHEVKFDGVDILPLGYRSPEITTSLDLAVVDPRSRAAAVDWRRVFARIMLYVDIATPSLDDLTSALGVAREPDDDLLEE